MQTNHFETFLNLLKQEDKKQSVTFALSLVSSKKLDIESLYKDILAPSLIYFECDEKDVDICIWKEHTRTSIIRTILESCYQYIEPKRQLDSPKSIVVLTPAFEYHEVAAIMSAHLFYLEGFNAIYVGANTPKNDIISALRAYQPEFIALSVTNPYNIVVTEQVCQEIKSFFPEIKIILGGSAFDHQHALEKINHDFYLGSLDDIKSFSSEVFK